MERLPTQGERLIRDGDGKAFEVVQITTVEGGELHYALRSAKGERVFLGADDFFPATRGPQPFRFAP